MEQQVTPKFLVKIVITLVLVSGIVVLFLYSMLGESLFYQVLFHLKKALAEGEHVREAILAYGPVAPLLFITLQMFQVVLAPVPGEATGILGGYLFGAWPGFFFSTIALTAGSGIAFAIGHLFSEALRKKYQTTKLYRTFNHLVYKGDFVIPFVLFLLPGFPKDILSYLLGMSLMPFRVFIFIAGVARIPGTLMLSFQGAKVYQEDYFQLLLLAVLSVVVSLPCYLYRRKILTFLFRYNNKATLKQD